MPQKALDGGWPRLFDRADRTNTVGHPSIVVNRQKTKGGPPAGAEREGWDSRMPAG
jgi:hypothetical protein